MSLLFFFLGKTEEVFGMHEWAEKQEEWIKCGKARKLKWKIFIHSSLALPPKKKGMHKLTRDL